MRLGSIEFWKNTRGTALAEAAIVLPLLVLMLGAAAEFGRFMYYYNTLGKATRAGARYIVTREVSGPNAGTNLADAKNLVVFGNIGGTGANVLNGANLTTARVEICGITGGGPPTCPAAGIPQTIVVRITGYSYTPLFAIGPMQSLGIDIQPSTTMRYMITTPTE
ncbi:MAG: TadE/TadG family type IV pilus assembly protein [bacterium]